MPIVYEYVGIKFGIFVDDHEPIHFHAEYNGAVIKVVLYVKNGYVYRVSYIVGRGKFPPAKLKLLKDFVSKYKQAMYLAYTQVINGVTLKRIVITKKI